MRVFRQRYSTNSPANPEFPAQIFNHVILCVPLEKDTVWLECTSTSNECGVLGSFTENKNALLLTENGGILIPTPKSGSAQNFLSTKTIINLNEEGGSKASSNIYCTGDFWNMFNRIQQYNNDEQKTIFIRYLNYRMPEEFQFENKGDSADGKIFSLNLSYDQQYDFKAGSKLFYPQKLNMLCSESINATTERKQDYIFDFPYNKKDTTIYILPAGTTVDNLPAKKEISNPYLY